MTKYIASGVIAIGILVLALVLAGSYTIIDAGNAGISVTLGKVDETVLPEGITVKLPFVTQIHEFSVRQQVETGKTQCFSSDLQTVDVSYTVMWRMPKDRIVEIYHKYSSDQALVYVNLVRTRWEDALKQAAARMDAEKIVKGRDILKDEAINALRKELGGLVEVIDIQLTDIGLSNELEKAIELKQVKQQEALAKTYELQREKTEAEIVLVRAKAEAEAIKVKGASIMENPKVIDLEIIKKWNGVSPTTVVTGDGGAQVLLPAANTGR